MLSKSPITVVFNFFSNMSPAGQLDHWWVSEHCLMDIGLAQYASSFRKNLVDGRVLGSLTRKDLERYLGMEGKKSHQDSILRTIELLTMLGFDRQVRYQNLKERK